MFYKENERINNTHFTLAHNKSSFLILQKNYIFVTNPKQYQEEFPVFQGKASAMELAVYLQDLLFPQKFAPKIELKS